MLLQLSLHQGLTQTANDDSFEPCLRVESGVDLSPGGHFSVSAATGGLAGNNCVISITVFVNLPALFSLTAPKPSSDKTNLLRAKFGVVSPDGI